MDAAIPGGGIALSVAGTAVRVRILASSGIALGVAACEMLWAPARCSDALGWRDALMIWGGEML